MDDFLHRPFYCEENVWHLAQHPATAGTERFVVVLTGARAEVACWQQKASDDGGPVLWDYHVILAVRAEAWRIWDLDSRAGCPLPLADWTTATFPWVDLVPARFQPRFALFSADDYVQRFCSDRQHMRDEAGGWLQAPPPWPVIDQTLRGHAWDGSSPSPLMLEEAIAEARHGLDLEGLAARLR